MAFAVYVLCALTSAACAVLLLRGYRNTKARLLLWSCLCFVFLATQNLFLILDLFVILNRDLSFMRGFSGLVGVALLLFGLVWDGE